MEQVPLYSCTVHCLCYRYQTETSLEHTHTPDTQILACGSLPVVVIWVVMVTKFGVSFHGNWGGLRFVIVRGNCYNNLFSGEMMTCLWVVYGYQWYLFWR